MKRVLGLFLLVFSAGTAWAQDAPKAELFAGYSLIRFGDGSPETFHGFLGGITYNFNPDFGIEGNFGFRAKSGLSQFEYLVGPQGHIRGERVAGVVHALVGGMTFSGGGASETGAAAAIGGGVEVKVNERLAVRAAQFDWMPIWIFGGFAKQNFRVSAGIVIKFGGGS